jgi:hypothetical protein
MVAEDAAEEMNTRNMASAAICEFVFSMVISLKPHYLLVTACSYAGLHVLTIRPD